MQLSNLAQNKDGLAATWGDFKATNEDRLKQMERKGYVDPITDHKLSKINNALSDYKSRIEGIETAINRPGTAGEAYDNDKNEHKSAFIDYVRKGIETNLHQMEKKYLSSSSDSDGGHLIEKKISQQIISRIEANSAMRKLASREEISTDVLDILEDIDDLDAGWVSEAEERKETRTPKLSKKLIKVHEIYAQPKATQKLIDDSRIDIEKWLVEKISDKFSAVENNSFIHGDGVNKPRGILSYAHGRDWGQIEQIVTASTSLNADDIIRLQHSLESKYAAKGVFLVHRNTLQAIRMLKSSNGTYLWNPAVGAGALDTLLGAPIVECSDMPIPKAGALPIAFADFNAAYKIVDRVGMKLIRDPFTEKPFIKFYTTRRVGGDVTNYRAIKLLKIAEK